MRKATAAGRGAIISDSIAVAVVSFGNDPTPLTLTKGATVQDALDAAAFSGTGELFVSGEKADRADVLEDGDVLSIVTAKQAGI